MEMSNHTGQQQKISVIKEDQSYRLSPTNHKSGFPNILRNLVFTLFSPRDVRDVSDRKVISLG